MLMVEMTALLIWKFLANKKTIKTSFLEVFFSFKIPSSHANCPKNRLRFMQYRHGQNILLYTCQFSQISIIQNVIHAIGFSNLFVI